MAIVGLVVLLGTTVAGGVVAWRQNQTAERWRQQDLAEITQNQSLTGQLTTARSNITTLNQQVSDLNGRISSMSSQITDLNQQLGLVANQKEKAIDRNTLLSQLLAAAGVVANRLQLCVNDTDTFISDVTTASQNGTLNLVGTSLQAEASTTNTVCNSAQQANQQLQSILNANP